MNKSLLLPILTILFSLGLNHNGSAQALLSPPFGLKWGDNSSKLMSWADTQKLNITINLPGKELEKRHIIISSPEGKLPGHEATSIEARFNRNRLYEVTLHYSDSNLTVHQSKAKFINARKALTSRHGPFKPSSNIRNNKNNYLSESVSYHVEPVSGLFLMITYTEIRDQLRKSAKSKFSLIYRNDNILPQ